MRSVSKYGNALGRPTKLTPELQSELCESLAAGLTITQFCRDRADCTLKDVMRWQAAYPEFREALARAKELQADAWADELLSLTLDENAPKTLIPGKHGDYEAVDNGAVQLRKLRADNLKWLMARNARSKYGERQQVEHSGDADNPVQVTIRHIGSPGEVLKS